MSDEVFSASALPANRNGHLSPGQMAALGRQARTSARTGVQAGLALLAFGALLIVGALSGRIASERFGALAIGVAMAALGGWMLKSRGLGRTGRASQSAAAGDDKVVAVSGDIRKQREAQGLVFDDLLGMNTHVSPGNEWQLWLHIGQRRLSVNQAQFDAAPDEGAVTAYLLPDTDHLVNLERTGPSGSVSAAQTLAAARGVLMPGTAMPPPSVLDGEALRRAVTGRWRNAQLGIELELRADGVAIGGMPGRTEHKRWTVTGAGELRVDEDTLRAALQGDTLTLMPSGGAAMRWQRI